MENYVLLSCLSRLFSRSILCCADSGSSLSRTFSCKKNELSFKQPYYVKFKARRMQPNILCKLLDMKRLHRARLSFLLAKLGFPFAYRIHLRPRLIEEVGRRDALWLHSPIHFVMTCSFLLQSVFLLIAMEAKSVTSNEEQS